MGNKRGAYLSKPKSRKKQLKRARLAKRKKRVIARMTYFEKNSNTEESVPQSEVIELFTGQYIKTEQSEIDYTLSRNEEINYNVTEHQLDNGAAAFYSFNEEKPEVAAFVSDEQDIDHHPSEEQWNEIDSLLNFNEVKPKEMGFVSDKHETSRVELFDKTKFSSEGKMFLPSIDSVKMEMETCTEHKIEIKKEFEELHLHEEIEIKEENEDELGHSKKTAIPHHLKLQTEHLGEKQFACNVCSYKSDNSRTLKRHQMIHTGEKPFACNVCDYKTTDAGHLKRHKMRHSGEKPFACNQCDYKTSDASHLKRHKMRHSREKPFACNQCDYKTTRSNLLKQHTRRHSGEKTICM